MSKVFFTSDTHFGHKNIITFCNRPYKNIEEMSEGLIQNWNKRISRGDSVYHLGDFSMGSKELTLKVLNRLKGNIFLVRGNHDDMIKGKLADRFAWIKDYYELKSPLDKRKIVLCHFPIQVWNMSHKGSWHLHGHCHAGLKQEDIKRLDIGVDNHNLQLVSLEEVKVFMDSQNVESVFPGEKKRP